MSVVYHSCSVDTTIRVGSWADSVGLSNGSTVQATILSISEGKLQLDTGYGKLTIPFKDIQTMNSDNPVWEQNKMQSLNSRTSIGVGVGHQFWDEPELNLKAELGVSRI